MTGIIAMLVARGLGERAARWLVLIALGVAMVGAVGLAKWRYDRAVVASHDARREAEIAPRLSRATAAAADQRATDTVTITLAEENDHHAIAQAPDGAPSAAAIALGCRRLRRAGANLAGDPACR